LYLRENNRVEALDLIQKALPLIPREDHHQLAAAEQVAGRLLTGGPSWQSGLAHLRRSVAEFEKAGEPYEQATALYAIIGAERDKGRKTAATEQLATLSFAGLATAEYAEAWRAVSLASLYLVDLHDLNKSSAQIQRVDAAGWIVTFPDLKYRYFFARANLALARGDGAQMGEAVRELKDLVKRQNDQEIRAEVLVLEMQFVHLTNDYKRALEIGEEVQQELTRGAIRGGAGTVAAFESEKFAFVLHTLAEVYRDMGLLPEGLDLVRRAISIYEELRLKEESFAAQLLYAQLWAQIDLRGAEEPTHVAEWLPVADIKSIHPTLTMVGGRVVFSSAK